MKRRRRDDKDEQDDQTKKPPPVWGLPKGAEEGTDKTDDDGTRTIEYDLDGHHHKIVVDKKGDAEEVITKDGKPVTKRKFKVEFDKKSGNRTETEKDTDKDGVETTRTNIYTPAGQLIEASKDIFTPAKTIENPDTRKIRTTKYKYPEGKRQIDEIIEEDLEYTAQGPDGTRQLTKGKRKTKTYKDGKPDKEKTEKWDAEKGKWVPE